MKIIVFADSHKDINSMRKAVKKEKPEMIIHLGDHVKDAIQLQKSFLDIKMEYVKGNTDIFDDYDREKLLRIKNINIFATHGDKYFVDIGIKRILTKGLHENADIILFGHTHKAYIDNHKGCLLMNPGSIRCKSSDTKNAAYGIIILNDDKIDIKIKQYDCR